MIVRDPPIIIVDKDFTEISCLKSVFVTSVVLLCVVHVLKYQRLLISTAKVDVEIKQEIMDAFKKMLYSQTEKNFVDNVDRFQAKIDGIDIRSNKKYVSFRTYFDSNWLADKDMWAMYRRKELPLLATIELKELLDP